MAIYFFTIVVMLGLAYHYDVMSNEKNKSIWINFIMVWLIALAGFRYRIGTDSSFYEFEFATYPTLATLSMSDIVQSRYAPFYVLFTSIVRTFTDQFFVIQLIISAAINISIFNFIKKFFGGQYIFTFSIFYFCSFYYNLNCETLRETLAIAIFLGSVSFYVEKKWMNYYLCVLCAMMFHYSAIALILLPLLYKVKFNVKFAIIVTGLVLSYPLLRLLQIDVIIERFFGLIMYIPNIAAEYFEEGLKNQELSINVFVTQLFMPLFFVFFLKYKNKDQKWEKIEFMIVAYLFTTWMAAIFQAMFSRYNNFFGVMYYCLYAATVVEITKRIGHKSIIIFLVVLMPFTYTTYNYWVNSYIHERLTSSKRIELINPYTNVLTKETDWNREKIYIELYKY